MCRFVVLVITSGFLVSQVSSSVEEDMKRLQGGWTVKSIEVSGMPVPEDKIGGRDGAFEGDQYLIHDFRLMVKIDPTKKPKTIDMNGKDGNGMPLSMVGIYDLNGDTLKICFAKPGSTDRPTKFQTKAKSGESLILYERQKSK
jgi:uncharacterized protein (TIGR03067 family)